MTKNEQQTNRAQIRKYRVSGREKMSLSGSYIINNSTFSKLNF